MNHLPIIVQGAMLIFGPNLPAKLGSLGKDDQLNRSGNIVFGRCEYWGSALALAVCSLTRGPILPYIPY